MIPLHDLSDAFSKLLAEYVDEAYRKDELPWGEHHFAARPLITALQDDWAVFSSAALAKDNACGLLKSLLVNAKGRSGASLKPESWVLRFSEQARQTEWRSWARMFPSDSAPLARSLEGIYEATQELGTLENRVADYLAYFAVLIQEGTKLFRARPGCAKNAGVPAPYSDLGPNPTHPESRANAGGQYSMYLAEVELTAIAEIRQSVGSLISVGEFAVGTDLTIVDLCQSFETPNPFVTKDLPWVLDLTYLLRFVAATMSKPAQIREDYLVTQLLANIARAVGYDGIRYPSAVNSTSRNIVLFKCGLVDLRASWVKSLEAESVWQL